jgi:SAM-dependent methyltransferase
MSHVLEHCIDPHTALRNVCSILKPGGCVVIEVPNNAAKGFARFGANWPWSDIPRHFNFFTERSLTALLRNYGLEISSVRYVGYFRQFAPDWIKTQNEIWAAIGTGSRPKFGFIAWLLLAQTAFTRSSRKYDSVRIHASKQSAI